MTGIWWGGEQNDPGDEDDHDDEWDDGDDDDSFAEWNEDESWEEIQRRLEREDANERD